jgi:hypothetical protein
LVVLELQTGFTSGIGQRCDPAMVSQSATVETDGLHTGCLGSLRDQFSNRFRRILAASGLQAAANALLHCGGRRQRFARIVIDDLRGNMIVASANGEPGPFRGTMQVSANATHSSLALCRLDFLFVHDWFCSDLHLG